MASFEEYLNSRDITRNKAIAANTAKVALSSARIAVDEATAAAQKSVEDANAELIEAQANAEIAVAEWGLAEQLENQIAIELGADLTPDEASTDPTPGITAV